MFKTVDQIRKAHKRTTERADWFGPGAMRYFDTELPDPKVYGGRYFVTSEQFHGSQGSGPREFSVRETSPDGASIDTVGTMGDYATLEDAQEDARRLAEEV